jgi:hypothetical protein
MYAYVLQLWDVGCIYVYGRVIRSKENAKKKIMGFFLYNIKQIYGAYHIIYNFM